MMQSTLMAILRNTSAVLVLAFVVQAVPASGQSHLEPEEGIFSSLGLEYDMAVHRVLLNAVSIRAAVVVMPSFESEWSAWVDFDSGPRACSRVVASPVWNGASSDQPNVPVTPPDERCAPLASDVATTIAEVWVAMLQGVRYPEPANSITVDGTIYHFLAFDSCCGRLAGRTHSPNGNSAAGQLVSLAETLRKFSLAPSSEAEGLLCKQAMAIGLQRRPLTSRCGR